MSWSSGSLSASGTIEPNPIGVTERAMNGDEGTAILTRVWLCRRLQTSRTHSREEACQCKDACQRDPDVTVPGMHAF